MAILHAQARLTRDVRRVGSGNWNMFGLAIRLRGKTETTIFANCIDYGGVASEKMVGTLKKGTAVIATIKLVEANEGGSLFGRLLLLEFPPLPPKKQEETEKNDDAIPVDSEESYF